MARLRSKHNFLLSKDSTETNQAFEKIQRDDELTDQFAKASSIAPLTLGPSGTSPINFQGITPIKFLYVETDKAVNLTINGSATPLQVVPRNNTATPASSLPGRFYLWTDGITSLTVSNPSAIDTAQVTVVFAGG